MSYKLLLYRDEGYPDSHIADRYPVALKEMLPDVEVVLASTRAEADAHIAGVDAAFGNLPPDLFARGKRLRWIQCPQAGPDPSFYHPALVASDVVVTNVRGIFNDHISAHILAMVLAFARGLPRYWAQQTRRDWTTGAPTFYLPECTAVILGAGGIGAETARLCAAFQMRVIAVDPRVESPPPGVAELVRPDRMNDAVARSDFVIVTVPETPATRGMFDSAFFARMKRGAVFINIGRGATVKLADLDAALRSGHLTGAGLDVFEREPLPADHPLWDAPGMLITPHVAAAGPYLDDRRAEVFLDNCRRFHDGRPLRNVVDKANWF
jgi:phosphoglycerate dehydrogenase-like enzyme